MDKLFKRHPDLKQCWFGIGAGCPNPRHHFQWRREDSWIPGIFITNATPTFCYPLPYTVSERSCWSPRLPFTSNLLAKSFSSSLTMKPPLFTRKTQGLDVPSLGVTPSATHSFVSLNLGKLLLLLTMLLLFQDFGFVWKQTAETNGWSNQYQIILLYRKKHGHKAIICW
jgi:hypothetical protein